MTVTRVFKSGNSKAVRIPKGLDLPLGDVFIEKRGEEIVIRKKPSTIGEILKDLNWEPLPNFMKGGRKQGKHERRRHLGAE